MKTYTLKRWAAAFLLLGAAFSSCQKRDKFLDVKSNKSTVRPATLQDFQAILDNSSTMNTGAPILGMIGSDNLYFTDAGFNSTEAVTRNAYIWAKDIYNGAVPNDWFVPYQMVSFCNIVLEGMKSLPANPDDAAYRNVQGSALFYRSLAFYRLVTLFAQPYTSSNTGQPGIPLRLTSDVTARPARATIGECYNQIISDLKQAIGLLPALPQTKTRPCTVAANALLAKVYMAMNDYTNAYTFINESLNGYSRLLDYKTLSVNNANPFPSYSVGNPEIVFYSQCYLTAADVGVISSAKMRADTGLMKLYQLGDLRKAHFFRVDLSTGLFRFKGSYSANAYEFTGIATDEMLLIRSECAARAGNVQVALKDLNTLLQNRFDASFSPLTETNPQKLLNIILMERRKELPFTGNTRWEDLRRLNQDPQFAKTITRKINNTVYTLAPNDNRYVLAIPDQEVQMSGMPQNPR